MRDFAGGTRLGPYEIVSKIGSGGVGVVYSARDTRLERIVAIKVLHEHLAEDSDLQQRFLQEAQAVSALNHPNICTLHDIGTEQGVQYLVMELLDGQTLEARIQRKGILPTDEMLQYAIQMADALDKAHRKGIIHRDLKPANVSITKSGVKLLDFGLAKVTKTPAPFTADMASNETEARNLTGEGKILGTLQYMSPEQLEGKPADHRSDIFSFGAVLYEMVTGHPAFQASSAAGLIAAILKEEPKPILVPLPVGLERLIRGCLAKDPEERRQSAHDVAEELKLIRETQTRTVPAERSPQHKSRRRWFQAAAVLAAVIGVALAIASLRTKSAPPAMSRFNLLLPTGFHLDALNTSLALSPDGRILAFTGTDRDGKTGLWLRRLDDAQPLAIDGAQDATYPFWSPDGRYIGFFAGRKLKKVPVSGSPVQTLWDAPDARGGAWNRRDLIVFSPNSNGGLLAISASGGSAYPITDTRGQYVTDRLPHFLPDGERVLYYHGILSEEANQQSGVYCLDLETKSVKKILSLQTEALFIEPFLMYVREGNLMAQRFDPGSLQLSGEADAIIENVQFYLERYTGAYALSKNLLIYQATPRWLLAQLTWFDLDGHKIGISASPDRFQSVELSPDGKRVLVSYSPNRTRDLYVIDFENDKKRRLTFQSEAYIDGGIAWSPDSSSILYGTVEGKLFIVPADASSLPRNAGPDTRRWWPRDWSSNGHVVMETHSRNGMDLGLLKLSESQVHPIAATDENEILGRLSPDGKWFGYVSDESGRNELYVVPYPAQSGKWQISTEGTLQWIWAANNKILYITQDRKLIAVGAASSGKAFDPGVHQSLFGGFALPPGLVSLATDGTRLLMALPVEEERQDTLNVIHNWAAPLQN